LSIEYVPVPSGLPTPYNISVGWNTIELDRGIYGDGNPRIGDVARPVFIFTVERMAERDIEWTTARWLRQLEDDKAESLGDF
jgi:hypothetical protein